MSNFHTLKYNNINSKLNPIVCDKVVSDDRSKSARDCLSEVAQRQF